MDYMDNHTYKVEWITWIIIHMYVHDKSTNDQERLPKSPMTGGIPRNNYLAQRRRGKERTWLHSSKAYNEYILGGLEGRGGIKSP